MARSLSIVVALGLLLGPSALPREINTEIPRPECDKKLLRAFPDEENLLRMPIRIYGRSRGFVLAASEFSIEPDGRVKFTPCRMARFNKKRPDMVLQTFHSEWVLVKMDKHVRSIAELGNRKMVNLELADGSRHVLKN